MPDSVKETEHLFTIIMQFAGTTSAAQVLAGDANQALTLWVDALSSGSHYGLSASDAARLRDSITKDADTEPVGITGQTNVWCTTALSRKDLAILHIIETVDQHAST
jgi:hypothetical protein